MSPWRQLTIGVRRLLRRDDAARDADDEVQHYLEQSIAAHQDEGLTPAEARRAARLELGSATAVTEDVRSSGWEHLVAGFLADLRLAGRRLRADPGASLMIVLTLALGIGASTAIMSAVGPILVESLPYPAADRLVRVWDIGHDGARIDLTFNTHRELRARATGLEALTVYRSWHPTRVGDAAPERLEGQRVSWEFFRVLGVAPLLGSDFREPDDRPGGRRTVILSHGLWQRWFNGDPAILGRPLVLDEVAYEVAVVMPREFENVLMPTAEIWAPLQYDASEGRAWGHHLRMIGRTRPGLGPEDLGRELGRIAAEPVAEFPRVTWAALGNGLLVTGLHADVTREIRPALMAILGAVVLLLVIACVNVTNLLLARGARRRSEYALRATLGAGAGRLVRQAVTESLFLAGLGGIAGLGMAVVGVQTLVRLSPAELPRLGAVGLDGITIALGLGLTALVGVVLGLLPARAALRSGAALGAGTRVTGNGHHRLRTGLVIAQVALALVLLVCSGLLLRSMGRLLNVPLGWEPADLLTLQVQTAGRRFGDDPIADRFFADVLDAVRRVPGQTEAALTSQLPLSGDLDLYGVHFEPASDRDPGEERGTFRYAVSPGYFGVMGIPLRRGRLLDDGDREGTVPVALVSESLAERRLPDQDPLGRQIRIGDRGPYTIVGVVGDVHQESLAIADAEAVYVTPEQWPIAESAMSLVVRGRGAVMALAPAVRQAVWSVDRGQPVVRQVLMADLVSAASAERRFALVIFQFFGLAALLLAAIGLSGVLAGSVVERTRELGVRAALGASPGRILALVLRQGMTMAGIGVLIGLGGAVAATTAIGSLLYGVTALDPITYLAVIGLLALVALVACLAPAWRAARVPPASPLRAE